LQLTGWSAYGLGSVLLYSFVQGEIPPGLIEGEIFQISFYIVSTHILRVLIKRGNWISLPLGTLILRIVLSIIILSFSNYVFLLGVSFQLDTLNRQDFLPINAIISIIAPLIMYFLWSLIYMTIHYFQWYKKSLEYQAAFNEIELNYLKSQLNPHFIFNALNSIRALVDEDPRKSKEAITQLSNILRNSLILDKKRLISFSDEMRTVSDYLALETIRFEERLQTEYDLHPESSLYNVPPMMIQTLVENGIKHGISNLTAGGTIGISTDIDDRKLIIQIKNSGNYKNGAQVGRNGTGTGLVNTKKRLELIYGDAASFKICNIEQNTVLTEITIPETF